MIDLLKSCKGAEKPDVPKNREVICISGKILEENNSDNPRFILRSIKKAKLSFAFSKELGPLLRTDEQRRIFIGKFTVGKNQNGH